LALAGLVPDIPHCAVIHARLVFRPCVPEGWRRRRSGPSSRVLEGRGASIPVQRRSDEIIRSTIVLPLPDRTTSAHGGSSRARIKRPCYHAKMFDASPRLSIIMPSFVRFRRPLEAPRPQAAPIAAIITVAALAARIDTTELSFLLCPSPALDSGTSKSPTRSPDHYPPAFSSGWANAIIGTSSQVNVFIPPANIGPGSCCRLHWPLLPLNRPHRTDTRLPGSGSNFGNVAPGIVQYTTDVLFRDLWLASVPCAAGGPKPGHGLCARGARAQSAHISYHPPLAARWITPDTGGGRDGLDAIWPST